MMKIGVIPDSFQVPFKEAVILARDMGVKGLQPYVTGGELCPEKLTKQDRADIIMREQLDINTANNEKMVGKTITVLCEDYDPVGAVHFGRGAADAPEIDGKIYFRSDVRIAPGSFVKVKLREVVDYDIIGRAITDSIS